MYEHIYLILYLRFKNCREVFTGRKCSLDADGTTFSLFLRNVDFSDAGEIECQARNRYGVVSTRARLTVLGKSASVVIPFAVRMFAFTCIFVYIYVYICLYIVYMCVCIYVFMYVYIYVCMYMHIYLYFLFTYVFLHDLLCYVVI